MVVAVTSTPFKCPPAPSETALLVHDHLAARGLLDRSTVSLVMPLGAPIPPSPAASEALLAAFAERGIALAPRARWSAASTRPRARCAARRRRPSCPSTCSSAYRCTGRPTVVLESGLAEDGWIPVDPLTLRTKYDDVYAVGDVTSVGTPKAGVFAEGQATVVAAQLIARARGEADADDVRRQRHLLPGVRGRPGRQGRGDLPERRRPRAAHWRVRAWTWPPTRRRFGAERIARWFGRDWTPLGG